MTPAQQKEQLLTDMDEAFAFFNLSPLARRVATSAALQQPAHAAECYRAISNSFIPTDPKRRH